MKTKLLAAALFLIFSPACAGDAFECVGDGPQQACVREVCDDEGACHFEVHSQAMTKAELIEKITKKKTLPDPFGG